MGAHHRLVCLRSRASSVVTIAIPTLPPRFRIKLKMPVAFPICSFFSVPIASVVMRHENQAIAKPLTMFGQITFVRRDHQVQVPKLPRRIRQQRQNPAQSATAHPRIPGSAPRRSSPRSTRTRAGSPSAPTVSDEYPSSVCRNSGSSAIEPYSTAPIAIISVIPVVKFRFFSTRKLNSG